MNESTIFVATGSVVAQFEGHSVYIHKGVTTVRAGHPLLDRFADLFVPLRPTFEVEPDPDGGPETENAEPPNSGDDPAAADESGPAPAGTPAPKDVRTWAAGQGIEVSAKGKLPDALVAQYLAAQQGA